MRNRRALPIAQEREFLQIARQPGAIIEIECVEVPDAKAPYAGGWLFYAVHDGVRFLLVNQKSREKVFRTHVGMAGMAAVLGLAELKTPRRMGLVSTGMIAGDPQLSPDESAD